MGGIIVKGEVLTVFIDESGNTGDIVISPKKFSSIETQPFFVLAGVGVFDNCEKDIIDILNRLKKIHRIQLNELKAKKIVKNRERFINELVNELYKNECPIFIELVDKKYFLISNIIQFVLIPPPIRETNSMDVHLLWDIADYLYSIVSWKTLFSFCKVCKTPSEINFYNFIDFIEKDLSSYNNELSMSLLSLIEQTKYIYSIIREENQEAYTYFLPPPDIGKRKDSLPLLPHSTSFVNICARAEKYRVDNGIEKLEFVHDESYYFDEILTSSLNWMKSLKEEIESPPYVKNHSKFNVSSVSQIVFEKSHLNEIIQIADILAGLMNYIWKSNISNVPLKNQYKESLELLYQMNSVHQSLGINFVVPKFQLYEFEKEYIR